MILVTGATGRTGRPLIERIVANGIGARVLVRDPGAAAVLQQRGLEAIVGDIGDDGVLQRAFDGVDRALLLTANGERQWEQERRFIETATAAGVGHVVKLSGIGADPGSARSIKRNHGLAERFLRQSAPTHTIIQANFYMDNLLGSAAEIAREGHFALPMGAGRVGAVDVRDVADAVLAALTRPGFENRDFLVTGPEVLSFVDMAGVLSQVLGREIAYIDQPVEECRQRLRGFGVPAWNVEAMLQLFELIRQDRNACVTDDFTTMTGRPPRSFRQFVADHAERFG